MICSHYETFEQRARNYRRLDERLAAHTRFFAAAALTNSVLAQLCVHRARWIWISRATLGALLTLGGMLERVNLRRAACIATDGCSVEGLDASIVEMEQAFVEAVLQEWALNSAPRYQRLITELDRLLRAVATGFLPPRGSPEVLRYKQVLRSVAVTTGRCPSFAVRADRIRIGKALIEEARQRSQPSTTSISLLGSAASSSQSSSSSRM